MLRNLNQPANGNGARPYPNFSHIQWRDPVGTSSYSGSIFCREAVRRGSATACPTRSATRAIEAPEHLAASSGRPQDTNDIAAWEGPSDFDVRHRLVANFIAKPVRPGSIGRPECSWRLDGQRHLHGAVGTAVHRHPGHSRGRDLAAESGRRPQGPGDHRQLVRPGGVRARARQAFRERRRNICAGPASRRST